MRWGANTVTPWCGTPPWATSRGADTAHAWRPCAPARHRSETPPRFSNVAECTLLYICVFCYMVEVVTLQQGAPYEPLVH
jgi:hypothetical protein